MYQKSGPYATLLISHMMDIIFIFHFGIFVALLPPLKTQKIKIIKNEKRPEDIIILHMFNKNYGHMIYSS